MHLPEDKEINYMEESVKIAKIKKSCHIGKIVSTILFAVAAVFVVLCLIGGVKVLKMGKEFDDSVINGRLSGVISTSDEIGSASAVSINLGSLPTEIHSDVPAIQAAIDDHPLSVMYGTYVLICSLILAITAVLFLLVRSVFAMVEQESTPFTSKVRKRVTLVLIVTCGILFLTTGSAFAILFALITWAVNAILDYGITLQIQSDETL